MSIKSIKYEIMRWRRLRVEASGKEPEFVPLRRDELLEIESDFTPVFRTPYAEEMRCRQVQMECVPFVTEFGVSELALAVSGEMWRDEAQRIETHRLKALVCADTTHIEITLEWDLWARWKRRLHLTRWFPVKTRTVKVEGRVLYPYLKVSLPKNRHHVRLALRP